MSTLEERLQAVEFDLKHYKTESIKAYSDMAMEFVMYKGLTEDAVKRIMKMQRTLDEHTALLNRQNERLEHLETTASEHTALLNGHTAILNEHTARFDRLEAIVSEHSARFDHLESLITQVLARLPEKL